MPASIPFDAVLLRTDDVAAFVSGLQVYRNGVRFVVEVRARTALLGHGNLPSAMHERGPMSLLIGVELADGRRCTHDRRGGFDSTGPALQAQGGGGGDRSAELELFLSPIPPAGDNKLVCAWPWLGIADQVTLLPTEVIQAAAADVIELWPWAPEGRTPEPEAAMPATPPGSWFSSTH